MHMLSAVMQNKCQFHCNKLETSVTAKTKHSTCSVLPLQWVMTPLFCSPKFKVVVGLSSMQMTATWFLRIKQGHYCTRTLCWIVRNVKCQVWAKFECERAVDLARRFMYTICYNLGNISYRSRKIAAPAVLGLCSLRKWLVFTVGAWWHLAVTSAASSRESRQGITGIRKKKRKCSKGNSWQWQNGQTQTIVLASPELSLGLPVQLRMSRRKLKTAEKRQLQRQSGMMRIQDACSQTWNLGGVLDDWQTWLDAPVERPQWCAGLTCTKTPISSVLHLLARGTTCQLHNKRKSTMHSKLSVLTWLATYTSCITRVTKIKGRNI